MTMVAGLDLETTGLDLATDHIVEISYVIVDTAAKRPLHAASYLVYEPNVMGVDPVKPEITAINGITNDMLRQYGEHPEGVFTTMASEFKRYGVEYLVGHNAINFDKPMLARVWPKVTEWPWLDTRADVEYPPSMTSMRLGHLAAEHGFLNHHAHTGLSDVLTMLKILGQYDIDKVIERSKTPWVVVRAFASFDQKELAKAQRYRWQEPGNGKSYDKCWVKIVKQDQVEKEIAALPGLQVKVIDG